MESTPKTTKRSSIKGNEWKIIEMYLDNKTEREIGTEVGATEVAIKKFITSVATSLNQAYETRKLLISQALDRQGNKYSWTPLKSLDSHINREFIKMISEPDSPVLTDPEMSFCYLLIYEGNAKDALKDAGLATGLKKSMGLKEYNRLLELRITYLKSKPNIIDYLRQLQIKYVDSLAVSKESIQAEIMRTLTYLRNQDDPKNTPTIARLIESLGKTEAVFVDSKQVNHTFSMDESFDIMMQRRKDLINDDESIELELSPSGTYVDPDTLKEESDEQE